MRLVDACLDLTDPFEIRVGLHDADGIYLTVKDKVSVFFQSILTAKKKKTDKLFHIDFIVYEEPSSTKEYQL